MCVVGGLTCLEALIAPAMRSLLSKRVAKSELGKNFKILNSSCIYYRILYLMENSKLNMKVNYMHTAMTTYIKTFAM